MKEQQADNFRRYKINEAADRLGISVITLRRKVLRGEIACYRPSGLGRRILFMEAHLQEFEERYTYQTKGAQKEKGLVAARPNS